MAKTKVANVSHRNTNKITVVLVRAVVEWVLILLLLFNSLLSYLIIKYAQFFQVEPPCPCCTISMHTDLVCEAHANQISKLGYCSDHRKLAQSQDMCLHCLHSDKLSLFPWRMGLGVVQHQKEKVDENDEVSLKCCCCCGVRLDHCNTTMFASYLLLRAASPWFHDKLTSSNHIQQGLNSASLSDGDMKDLEEDEILHSRFFLHYNDHDRVQDWVINNRSILDQMGVALDFDINVEPKLPQEEQNSLVLVVDEFQEMAVAASASEEVAQISTNGSVADVSIGTEIPDVDDEAEDQEAIRSYECTHDLPSMSSANLDEADDQGPVQGKEEMMEFQCLSFFKDREYVLKTQPPFQLDLNEIEDDGVPNTPASVDCLNQLHRTLAFLEKRDFCSEEESVDGSVTSKLEGDEGVATIESLKLVLRAERKSLQALYDELEEERSASAEAANQAMAMINRLQGEKAAMQMEAFQYQRMMEEQSEYDQEALHLMNDLMVKREKEKQELEKELELYRKKLLHYETKEKLRMLKKSSTSGSILETKEKLLQECLADFEEERLSILEELKVLEGLKEMSGKHHHHRRKSLAPIFDFK